MSDALAIYLVLIGAFSLVVAVFNWDWAFRRWGALLEKVLGRNGTRWVYVVMGVIAISIGVIELLNSSAK